VRSSPAVASSQPGSILAAAGDSPTLSRPLLGASLRLERKISAFFAAKSDRVDGTRQRSVTPMPRRYCLLRVKSLDQAQLPKIVSPGSCTKLRCLAGFVTDREEAPV